MRRDIPTRSLSFHSLSSLPKECNNFQQYQRLRERSTYNDFIAKFVWSLISSAPSALLSFFGIHSPPQYPTDHPFLYLYLLHVVSALRKADPPPEQDALVSFLSPVLSKSLLDPNHTTQLPSHFTNFYLDKFPFQTPLDSTSSTLFTAFPEVIAAVFSLSSTRTTTIDVLSRLSLDSVGLPINTVAALIFSYLLLFFTTPRSFKPSELPTPSRQSHSSFLNSLSLVQTYLSRIRKSKDIPSFPLRTLRMSTYDLDLEPDVDVHRPEFRRQESASKLSFLPSESLSPQVTYTFEQSAPSPIPVQQPDITESLQKEGGIEHVVGRKRIGRSTLEFIPEDDDEDEQGTDQFSSMEKSSSVGKLDSEHDDFEIPPDDFFDPANPTFHEITKSQSIIGDDFDTKIGLLDEETNPSSNINNGSEHDSPPPQQSHHDESDEEEEPTPLSNRSLVELSPSSPPKTKEPEPIAEQSMIRRISSKALDIIEESGGEEEEEQEDHDDFEEKSSKDDENVRKDNTSEVATDGDTEADVESNGDNSHSSATGMIGEEDIVARSEQSAPSQHPESKGSEHDIFEQGEEHEEEEDEAFDGDTKEKYDESFTEELTHFNSRKSSDPPADEHDVHAITNTPHDPFARASEMDVGKERRKSMDGMRRTFVVGDIKERRKSDVSDLEDWRERYKTIEKAKKKADAKNEINEEVDEDLIDESDSTQSVRKSHHSSEDTADLSEDQVPEKMDNPIPLSQTGAEKQDDEVTIGVDDEHTSPIEQPTLPTLTQFDSTPEMKRALTPPKEDEEETEDMESTQKDEEVIGGGEEQEEEEDLTELEPASENDTETESDTDKPSPLEDGPVEDEKDEKQTEEEEGEEKEDTSPQDAANLQIKLVAPQPDTVENINDDEDSSSFSDLGDTDTIPEQLDEDSATVSIASDATQDLNDEEKTAPSKPRSDSATTSDSHTVALSQASLTDAVSQPSATEAISRRSSHINSSSLIELTFFADEWDEESIRVTSEGFVKENPATQVKHLEHEPLFNNTSLNEMTELTFFPDEWSYEKLEEVGEDFVAHNSTTLLLHEEDIISFLEELAIDESESEAEDSDEGPSDSRYATDEVDRIGDWMSDNADEVVMWDQTGLKGDETGKSIRPLLNQESVENDLVTSPLRTPSPTKNSEQNVSEIITEEGEDIAPTEQVADGPSGTVTVSLDDRPPSAPILLQQHGSSSETGTSSPVLNQRPHSMSESSLNESRQRNHVEGMDEATKEDVLVLPDEAIDDENAKIWELTSESDHSQSEKNEVISLTETVSESESSEQDEKVNFVEEELSVIPFSEDISSLIALAMTPLSPGLFTSKSKPLKSKDALLVSHPDRSVDLHLKETNTFLSLLNQLQKEMEVMTKQARKQVWIVLVSYLKYSSSRHRHYSFVDNPTFMSLVPSTFHIRTLTTQPLSTLIRTLPSEKSKLAQAGSQRRFRDLPTEPIFTLLRNTESYANTPSMANPETDPPKVSLERHVQSQPLVEKLQVPQDDDIQLSTLKEQTSTTNHSIVFTEPSQTIHHHSYPPLKHIESPALSRYIAERVLIPVPSTQPQLRPSQFSSPLISASSSHIGSTTDNLSGFRQSYGLPRQSSLAHALDENLVCDIRGGDPDTTRKLTAKFAAFSFFCTPVFDSLSSNSLLSAGFLRLLDNIHIRFSNFINSSQTHLNPLSVERGRDSSPNTDHEDAKSASSPYQDSGFRRSTMNAGPTLRAASSLHSIPSPLGTSELMLPTLASLSVFTAPHSRRSTFTNIEMLMRPSQRLYKEVLELTSDKAILCPTDFSTRLQISESDVHAAVCLRLIRMIQAARSIQRAWRLRCRTIQLEKASEVAELASRAKVNYQSVIGRITLNKQREQTNSFFGKNEKRAAAFIRFQAWVRMRSVQNRIAKELKAINIIKRAMKLNIARSAVRKRKQTISLILWIEHKHVWMSSMTIHSQTHRSLELLAFTNLALRETNEHINLLNGLLSNTEQCLRSKEREEGECSSEVHRSLVMFIEKIERDSRRAQDSHYSSVVSSSIPHIVSYQEDRLNVLNKQLAEANEDFKPLPMFSSERDILELIQSPLAEQNRKKEKRLQLASLNLPEFDLFAMLSQLQEPEKKEVVPFPFSLLTLTQPLLPQAKEGDLEEDEKPRHHQRKFPRLADPTKRWRERREKRKRDVGWKVGEVRGADTDESENDDSSIDSELDDFIQTHANVDSEPSKLYSSQFETK
ncbi:hypothetical protein BLNAU_15567 [Blattamonas nauphoetae]|uniref:Uncharacterized protein n=1 Tax=Blattamonas nauphoetae TaxID=2049346 RepID=A0ABQ9XF54_9EUKA|nr:hypothetical protein BLNAU_15567 [Blattamonas nauphoetae]